MTTDDNLPRIDYTIPPDVLKKINELLAPIGWSAGRIFRARNIELNDIKRELDSARYSAELEQTRAGKMITYAETSKDPEYKKIYEKYIKLFEED